MWCAASQCILVSPMVPFMTRERERDIFYGLRRNRGKFARRGYGTHGLAHGCQYVCFSRSERSQFDRFLEVGKAGHLFTRFFMDSLLLRRFLLVYQNVICRHLSSALLVLWRQDRKTALYLHYYFYDWLRQRYWTYQCNLTHLIRSRSSFSLFEKWRAKINRAMKTYVLNITNRQQFSSNFSRSTGTIHGVSQA